MISLAFTKTTVPISPLAFLLLAEQNMGMQRRPLANTGVPSHEEHGWLCQLPPCRSYSGAPGGHPFVAESVPACLTHARNDRDTFVWTAQIETYSSQRRWATGIDVPEIVRSPCSVNQHHKNSGVSTLINFDHLEKAAHPFALHHQCKMLHSHLLGYCEIHAECSEITL